jgi:hypothetical protein
MIRSSVRTLVRREAYRLSIALLLFAADIGVAGAQDTTSARRDGWIVGPLVGLPGAGSDYELSLVTLGVGVTRLSPNRPGLDFAVGTIPRIIPEGVIPIGARIGASIPLSLTPDAFLIPSAGLSGVGAVGSGGAAGTGGYYGGITALVARGSVGFRAGVTVHGTPDADLAVWLVEIGVMRVPVPRRAN